MKTIHVSSVHHWEGTTHVARYYDDKSQQVIQAFGWTTYSAVQNLRALIGAEGEMVALSSAELPDTIVKP